MCYKVLQWNVAFKNLEFKLFLFDRNKQVVSARINFKLQHSRFKNVILKVTWAQCKTNSIIVQAFHCVWLGLEEMKLLRNIQNPFRFCPCMFLILMIHLCFLLCREIVITCFRQFINIFVTG